MDKVCDAGNSKWFRHLSQDMMDMIYVEKKASILKLIQLSTSHSCLSGMKHKENER